jgi:triosephosphate isomerase
MSKFRKKIIAGNWKMNKTATEAKQLAADIAREVGDVRDVDVVICPPFTSTAVVGDEIQDSSVKLGAQNMHWEAEGAFTGEVSASMLRGLYVHYVILGHSERRQYFAETDETVNKKVKVALASNLIPILCCGETLEQRDAGEHVAVVSKQIREDLVGVDAADAVKLVLAYEPIWAIGTGRTASPEQAQEMHASIRAVLTELFGEEIAQSLRIQYGGSMKPGNAAELMAQPDIDGGLIGGAALDANSFGGIIAAARG